MGGEGPALGCGGVGGLEEGGNSLLGRGRAVLEEACEARLGGLELVAQQGTSRLGLALRLRSPSYSPNVLLLPSSQDPPAAQPPPSGKSLLTSSKPSVGSSGKSSRPSPSPRSAGSVIGCELQEVKSVLSSSS